MFYIKDKYEDNFIYLAQVLKKDIGFILSEDINTLLISVLKTFFEDSLAAIKMTVDEMTKSIQPYKLIYDYIIKADPGWIPKPKAIPKS
jgi:hypothetical protein